jgi:hypothetical protein
MACIFVRMLDKIHCILMSGKLSILAGTLYPKYKRKSISTATAHVFNSNFISLCGFNQKVTRLRNMIAKKNSTK